MGFEALFVCSANVCRSPAAAALFRDGLFRAGLPASVAGSISVDDAGVAARSDLPMCPDALEFVTRRTGPEGAPQGHRPSRLGVGRIEGTDLVVALDRDVRAAVLGRALGQVSELRPRLFTLLEAAALAQGVATALVDSSDPDEAGPGAVGRPGPLRLDPLPDDADKRLTWLVAEMDAARGLVPARHHRRFGRRREVDVYDAHGARGHHRETLHLIDESVQTLLAAIGCVLAVDPVTGRAEGRRIKR